MRRLAVALLVAGLAVLLTSLAPAAIAAPNPPPVPTGPTANTWVRLTVTSQQPRVVTATDTSVTVTATVSNVSDRRIRLLTARLQVGDAVTSGTALRSALSPTANYIHGNTVFTPKKDTLEPGASVSFTVTANLQGTDSLQVTRPGVYPLMVNVQGVPDFGAGARLAAATVLLPVLSTPSGGAPAPGGAPSGLTMLWPLIDQQPRVVGTTSGQVVLSDDTLAASLGSGGRLFGLLDAVRRVSADSPALLSALCFAVDPDLLATVRDMAGGYRVATGGGTSQPGQGAAAAGLWLTTLKGLAANHCVLALPYADADLAALAHAGGTDLMQLAITDGATEAKNLGGTTITDVAWPADNTLDTRTLTDLAGLGVHNVLLNPASLTQPATGPAPVAGFTGGNRPTVLPIDPVVTAELAARTDEPNVDQADISAQDGMAAIVYQTAFHGAAGQPLLVAPPRRWAPSATEAQAFLRCAATVLAEHYATATALSDAVTAPQTSGPVTLNYTPQESVAEVAHPVVTSAVQSDAAQRDVLAAMGRDHTAPNAVQPAALIDPLRTELLRVVSSAWRDGRTSGASAALGVAGSAFDALRQQVTVVQSGLPILLGSRDSRLPVTVTNNLSVDIAVRVDVTGDPGLPSSGAEDLIPAHASITVFIQTKVTRTGRFSVFATVSTPGGVTELGQQARLELTSTAYGTIIVIVTAIAFGLLVLLSGRRIYRRIRAARGTAPAPPPDATTEDALVDGPYRAHSEQREPGRS
ncbi:MAG TPA: DUF6049 family protein [Pseudonocardiaceae bacterium]|nr:DUF6049 family protein [Pseudonocardiaceae bacterium]